MYSAFQLAKKYLHYYFTSTNGKGHGVHSPFVYELIREVLNDKRHFYAYDRIEHLRHELLRKNEKLDIVDLGAGSGTGATNQRSIQSIARYAAKPKKWGQLLFRLVQHYQPQNIIELGTSLGLTTAYMAAAKSSATVITIEGSPAIAKEADYHFHSLKLKNIRQLTGNFDEQLAPALMQMQQIDFAFIDGNHRLHPTLWYFEQLLPYTNEYSILVFDDIHWSTEMEEAWEAIKANLKVRLTIDLFFIGLVFFRKEFKEKQNFIIRY